MVVATSHLESPCIGPPTWDQTYSKERIAQAEEAVTSLSSSRNVAFGGDMNWDDKSDGKFPISDGWVDAWAVLKPEKTDIRMTPSLTRCCPVTGNCRRD